MFLPWTIFVINIVISVFNFLLVAAFESILAWYSQYGGEFASAIRWARQGGYSEMVYSFLNSHNVIPNSTRRMALGVIISSVVVSVLDKGISYFIEENATEEINKTTLMMKSDPYACDWDLPTWSTYVRNDTNITDVMQSMINDTRSIPNAIIGKVYKPRLFEYESGCGNFNLDVVGLASGESLILPLLEEGCMNATFTIGELEATFMTWGNATVNGFNDRWTIIASFSNSTLWSVGHELPLKLKVGPCAVGSIGIKPKWFDGVSSHPMTIATKCPTRNGTTIVLSASTTRFSTFKDNSLSKVMSYIFGHKDELIQAMELHENTSLLSPTALVVELKVVNTAIDVLACYSYNVTHHMYICVYASFNAIALNPQLLDFQLTTIIDESDYPVATNMFTIYHIPEMRNGDVYIPVLRTKNASLEVVRFFARLGQNFYMDWSNRSLYVLYDTFDVKLGVDAPKWLTTLVVIIMALSFLIWFLTILLLDGKYGDSLYGIISTQMATRTGTKAPMLMKFKFDPPEFEGVPLVKDDKEDIPDIEDEKDEDEKDTQLDEPVDFEE